MTNQKTPEGKTMAIKTAETPEFTIFSENVEYVVIDGVVLLKIDASRRGERSSSGKSIRVATTNGFKPVPGTSVFLNLHVYTK